MYSTHKYFRFIHKGDGRDTQNGSAAAFRFRQEQITCHLKEGGRCANVTRSSGVPLVGPHISANRYLEILFK